jgi:hypothetical protein
VTRKGTDTGHFLQAIFSNFIDNYSLLAIFNLAKIITISLQLCEFILSQVTPSEFLRLWSLIRKNQNVLLHVYLKNYLKNYSLRIHVVNNLRLNLKKLWKNKISPKILKSGSNSKLKLKQTSRKSSWISIQWNTHECKDGMWVLSIFY